MQPLEPLAGEMLKFTPGKCCFSLLRFILLPDTRLPSLAPALWGGAWCRSGFKEEMGILPQGGVLGIPEVTQAAQEDALCPPRELVSAAVWETPACLEFAALLPRKKELRNRLVLRSQAGKLQNKLINWTETVTGHTMLTSAGAKSDV